MADIEMQNVTATSGKEIQIDSKGNTLGNLENSYTTEHGIKVDLNNLTKDQEEMVEKDFMEQKFRDQYAIGTMSGMAGLAVGDCSAVSGSEE